MRRILAVILAVICIVMTFASCSFFDGGVSPSAESAIPMEFENVVIEGKFSDVSVLSAQDAVEALNSVQAELGFAGAATENFQPLSENNLGAENFYRVEQILNNIPVYGRSMVVVADTQGTTNELSGNYADVGNLDLQPNITYEAAFNAAVEFLKSEGITDASDHAELKGLTYYTFSAEPALCWHIAYSSMRAEYQIFIDASNGKITDTIFNEPYFAAAPTVTVKGQADASYTLPYRMVSGENVLYDSERNIVVKTLNYKDIDNFPDDGLFNLEVGDYIGITNINKSAADALGNAIGVYDFYSQVLGRKQYDGKNTLLPIYVNGEDEPWPNGSGQNGLFYKRGYMVFSVESGKHVDEYSKNLDVVGHEFTHGVNNTTWDVFPINNPHRGAMQEAIADIMGDMVERFITGTNDWNMAGSIRDMTQRKTMDDFSFTGSSHGNAVIIDYAAYKMWEGDHPWFGAFGEQHDGIKESGSNTSVMSKLWYGVQLRLTPNSTFWDCRRAAEASAKSLQRQGLLTADQVKTVGWAFDEVEIFDFGSAAGIGADWIETIKTPDEMTVTIGEVSVIEADTVPVILPDGISIEWSIADESIATIDNKGIIYGLKTGTTEITARAHQKGNYNINGREYTCQTTLHVTPVARDSILVLDISGSMSGTPLTEMKKAAVAFCQKVLEDTEANNRVGLVVYDTYVYLYDLTSDIDSLKNTINNLRDGSRTNLQGALSSALDMMDSQGRAGSTKNIVVMTDGLPNEGNYSSYGYFGREYSSTTYYTQYADSALETAETIMQKYNLYSLGYFHSLSGTELNYAKDLMERIQNKGYYQVTRAEDLEYVFADITANVSSGARLVINIACPVDVEISYGGEQLSSSASNYNDFASFGTLQLLGKNRDIKVLSLSPNINYDIRLSATDEGEMDYTANYFNDNEAIVDSRKFPQVPLTPTTYITANSASGESTRLNIDTDRDGTVDMIWEAASNGLGKQIWKQRTFPIVAVVLIVIFAAGLIAGILVLATSRKRSEKKVLAGGYGFSASNKSQGCVSILSGSMSGANIPIMDGETLRIGRDPSWASLVLHESQISRRHCSITYSRGQNCYFVLDESQHGTFLSGGSKLDSSAPVRVEKGERLTLASEKGCIILLD